MINEGLFGYLCRGGVGVTIAAVYLVYPGKGTGDDSRLSRRLPPASPLLQSVLISSLA